jgi:IS5 family transposase
LEESLHQSERVRKYIGGTRPKIAGIDSDCRGKTEVVETLILLPKSTKESSRYKQEVTRKSFRARAAIEPRLSHFNRNHI